MKKRLSLILLTVCTVLLAIALTSCDAGKIERAVERTAEKDSYDATLELSLKVNDVTTRAVAEIEINDPELGKEKAHYKITANNVTTDIYKDGAWLYIPSEQAKVSERGYEGVAYKTYEELLEDIVEELPDGLAKEATITKDDDEYILEAVLTKGEIADDYEDAIEAIKNYYALRSAAVEKASIRVEGEGRYINEYILNITFKDDNNTYEVVAKVEYDDPGERVEIDFPKGYENYKEK